MFKKKPEDNSNEVQNEITAAKALLAERAAIEAALTAAQSELSRCGVNLDSAKARQGQMEADRAMGHEPVNDPALETVADVRAREETLLLRIRGLQDKLAGLDGPLINSKEKLSDAFQKYKETQYLELRSQLAKAVMALTEIVQMGQAVAESFNDNELAGAFTLTKIPDPFAPESNLLKLTRQEWRNPNWIEIYLWRENSAVVQSAAKHSEVRLFFEEFSRIAHQAVLRRETIERAAEERRRAEHLSTLDATHGTMSMGGTYGGHVHR